MSTEQAESDSDSGTYVTVRQGDCAESIAFEKGLFWETIWNDGRNAELKNERQSPNELLPGDRIFVPDNAQERGLLRDGAEASRFGRKGVPSKLDLVIQVDGEPIAQDAVRDPSGRQDVGRHHGQRRPDRAAHRTQCAPGEAPCRRGRGRD